MASKEQLFGFNRTDADAILAGLPPTGGSSVSQSLVPDSPILLAQSKSTGIGANNSANVFYMEPTATGWSATTIEYLAYNPTSTAIGNSKLLLLFPVNGRWIAVELCT